MVHGAVVDRGTRSPRWRNRYRAAVGDKFVADAILNYGVCRCTATAATTAATTATTTSSGSRCSASA
jgi:hypothetical protein